jgi:hypothetical protein
VRVLCCLFGAALVIVAVPAPHAVAPAAISYRADLARVAADAPYPAVAPAGLPASWQPVSSGVTLGGADGPGTVTWHLGYLSPDGSLASVEQSNEPAAGFLRRMTNDGTPLAPVRLAGASWNRSATPDRGQRSLYRTASGFTVVVTGNATWAELADLAAALRPAAR